MREHVVAQGCRAAFAGADELDEWYGAELLAAGISREARAAVPGAAGGRAWAGGVGLVKAVEVGRGCPHWHFRSAPDAIVRSAPPEDTVTAARFSEVWRCAGGGGRVSATCVRAYAGSFGRFPTNFPSLLRRRASSAGSAPLPAARSVFAFSRRRARVARITRMLNDAKANHGALPCASPSHGC